MSFPILTFRQGGWCPALNKSYARGFYQPKSKEEYDALAPYAESAAPLPPDDKAPDFSNIDVAATDDRDALMAYAKHLGLTPAWNIGIEKLRAMITEHLEAQNSPKGEGTE